MKPRNKKISGVLGGLLLLFLSIPMRSEADEMPVYVGAKVGIGTYYPFYKLSPSYSFFQPVPIYTPFRTFDPPTAPPTGDLAKHWYSDVSRVWCSDSAVQTASGNTVNERCNDYDTALHGTSTIPADADLPDSQILMPRQIAFAGWMYWPFCELGVKLGSDAETKDLASLGWSFDKYYAYSGCYGSYEPVVAPYINQKGKTASQVMLANSSGDFRPDKADNVIPFLPVDFDPVNLAFEMDRIDTKYYPVSVTTGNFITPTLDLSPTTWTKSLGGDEGATMIYAYLGKFLKFFFDDVPGWILSMLGQVDKIFDTNDVAILMRHEEGSETVGYVSFIENRGMTKDAVCATKAIADKCLAVGTCTDPLVTWTPDCSTCVTEQPVIDALNACQRTTNYDSASPELKLEGSSDPVFVGKYLVWAATLSTGTGGAHSKGSAFNKLKPLLVVGNRSPIDCFSLDHHDIRFRNPALKAADGSLKDKNGDGTVDIYDSEGIAYYPYDGSTGNFSPVRVIKPKDTFKDVGAERCSYLTFYNTYKDDSGFHADAMKAKDGHVIKIPVGFNVASMDSGDFNGDGIPDVIVANVGSEAEHIAGSFSVVQCHDDDDPAATGDVSFLNCKNGVTVRDYPIGPDVMGSDGTALKSRHPWTVVSKGFVAHYRDIDNSGSLTDGDEIIHYGDNGPPVLPKDGAATFIDSHEVDRGDFLVLFNDVNETVNKKAPDYRFWNDLKFTYRPVPTDELYGATPSASLVPRLSKDYSLYPLAIAAAPFNNALYHTAVSGVDAWMINMVGEMLQGFQWEANDSFQTPCETLMVGMNNSHRACGYPFRPEGQKANVVLGKDGNGDPIIYALRACSETLVTPASSGISGGKVKPGVRDKLCPDTTTPIYNAGDAPKAPSYNNDGNWGAVYMDVSWINDATERNGRPSDGGMAYQQLDAMKAVTTVIDMQKDFTFDLGVVNGHPTKLHETKVLEDGRASYSLPNDSCKRDQSEVTAIIHKTTGRGDPVCISSTTAGVPTGGAASPKTCWDAGKDAGMPHRCAQRHGSGSVDDGLGLQYLRGNKATACCLILDHPEVLPAGTYKGDSVPATSCPEDPMRCCIMQMPATVSLADLDSAVPTVTNAVYNGASAKSCSCLAKFDAMKKAEEDAKVDPSLIAEWSAAVYDYSCCIDPTASHCKSLPPPPGLCEGIADPDLKACCVAGKSFAECGKECTGIADPTLKKCCDDGKTFAECMPPPPPTKNPTCDSMPEPFKDCCKAADSIGNHNNMLDMPSSGVPGSAAELIAFYSQEACFPKNDPHDPGDDHTNTETCSNTSIINIGAGATVTGDINVAQCCQVVTLIGSTAKNIINSCSNGGKPGSDCSSLDFLSGDVPSYCNPNCANTPTDPSCQPPTKTEGLAPAACECAPVDPKSMVGKDITSMMGPGKPTPFACQYHAPSTEGPLALTTASTLETTTEGDFTTFNPADPTSSGKNMTFASLPTANGDTSTVYAPLIKSWNEDPNYNKGMVHMKAVALDGTVLSAADCVPVAKLGVQGGGSSGCSIALGHDPKNAAANGLLAMILISLPYLLRRKTVKTK